MQRKGKTFIVSGPSGVGKSTVLKALFDQRTTLFLFQQLLVLFREHRRKKLKSRT